MKRRKIKIIFLIDELLAPGGTEKQLIFLAENLPRDRFEPIIAVLYETSFLSSLQIMTPVITFKTIRIPFLKNADLIRKLRLYIHSNRIDILQTQFVGSAIYGALSILLMCHRPLFISTRRNMYHWIDENPWLFRLLRATNRIADRVLVNSASVLEECRKIEKVLPQKITLIQNAVEVERFSGVPKNEAKKRLGLGGDYPVIGVVGNWRPVKGLAPFIQAAARIYQRLKNARFVLVGYGPQENDLRSLAHDLGIKHRVVFFSNANDIPAVMSAFDIAVQPSLSESFSNVLIEYMAAAKPIVATKVGDAEMVIEDGKEGLLVQPNDPEKLAGAILSIYDRKDDFARMGQLAREKVIANWSSDKILEKYQFFYEDLVELKGDSD